MDTATGEPIAQARVFVDKTTVFTYSDEEGYFRLEGVPAGLQELTLYHPNFELGSVLIDGQEQAQKMEVGLAARPELDADTSTHLNAAGPLDSTEDAGVDQRSTSDQRALDALLDIFFAAGDECRVVNTDAIDAQTRPNGDYAADILEPIILENERLGYTVTAHMTHIVANQGSSGYALRSDEALLFEPESSVPQRVRDNREEAYIGSFQHVLASIAEQRLYREGLTLEQPIGAQGAGGGLGNVAGEAAMIEGWTELSLTDRMYSVDESEGTITFTFEGPRRLVHRSRNGLQRSYASNFAGSTNEIGRPVSYLHVEEEPAVLTMAGHLIEGGPVDRQGTWANTPLCHRLPDTYRPNE